MAKTTISALVVVHNEEAALEFCLRRLSWVDDLVVVLDRCTARSKSIAERYDGRILAGPWEFEGVRRNCGIELCQSDWILEVNADEWITKELEEEILETINNPQYDIYNLKIDNYIGNNLIVHGWDNSYFLSWNYIGLFRKGTKSWDIHRSNPDFMVTGTQAPHKLINPVKFRRYLNISEMLRRLDRDTTIRAKYIANNREVTAITHSFSRFLSQFFKVYIPCRAYKEGGYGFMMALCAGLYPLISNVKAIYEEIPRQETVNEKDAR